MSFEQEVPLSGMQLSQCECPVFIVGAPRSGTTLLATILSAHSQFQCGPETHFFSKTTAKDRDAATSDAQWPDKACELIAQLTINEQKVHDAFGITLSDIRHYLESRPSTDKAMLEALCHLHATRNGKQYWIEKTPNHLLHLDEIRSLFPNAKVIRIVRDPRDVAVSMCKLPWSSSQPLGNLYLRVAWELRSRAFFSNSDDHFSLRYEDLSTNPAGELERLCKYLGVEFEARMLDHASARGPSLAAVGETWKNQVFSQIDQSRVEVWKRELETQWHQLFEMVSHEILEEFGYEHTHGPASSIWVYPCDRQFVEENQANLQAAARSSLRFMPLATFECLIKQGLGCERLMLAGLGRMGRSGAERLETLGRLAAMLLKRRALRRPAVRLEPMSSKGGVVERLGLAASRLTCARTDMLTLADG